MNLKARAAVLLLLAAITYLILINRYQAKVIDQQHQVIRQLFAASGGSIT